jgi:transposase-like protein
VGKPTKTKIDRKTLPAGIAKVLKRLHYPLDVILLSVRWYVAYSLSLRNLEEMIAERGFEVDHSTVHRWVIKLVPLFEKAFRKHKRPVGKSWRMDETYIKVKGGWKYLYRAVDKARPSTFSCVPTATRLRRVATSRKPSTRTAPPRRSPWTKVAPIWPP